MHPTIDSVCNHVSIYELRVYSEVSTIERTLTGYFVDLYQCPLTPTLSISLSHTLSHTLTLAHFLSLSPPLSRSLSLSQLNTHADDCQGCVHVHSPALQICSCSSFHDDAFVYPAGAVVVAPPLVGYIRPMEVLVLAWAALPVCRCRTLPPITHCFARLAYCELGALPVGLARSL